MSSKKSVKLVNMTSTQIFKNQAENIYQRLRLESGPLTFAPTHMGGVPGQRDILIGKNTMREITVVDK